MGPAATRRAAAVLEELVAEAAEDGVDLWVTTAYRDFEHQRALYEQRHAEGGQEAADELTARPGFSEHQTGLAVDMSFEGNTDCNLRACFADTGEASGWQSMPPASGSSSDTQKAPNRLPATPMSHGTYAMSESRPLKR